MIIAVTLTVDWRLTAAKENRETCWDLPLVCVWGSASAPGQGPRRSIFKGCSMREALSASSH